MNDPKLPSCAAECLKVGEKCQSEECKFWVEYELDENCSLISIYKNGAMTLNEVSKRMKISLVRVSQIEKQALNKLSKRIKI